MSNHPPFQPWDLAAVLVILVLVYLIFQQAPGLWWQIDDPQILKHAIDHGPWDYFFDPPSWRELSTAHLTPWVTLSLDLDLVLFGMDPRPLYLHQLASVTAAALATLLLLRLWVGPGMATLAVAVFLLGAPLGVAGFQLMTRHYLEGLTLGALAILCYVIAVRTGRWRWALLGALAYLLACTAKELFPPLIGILPFLPEGDWRQRLRFAGPYLGVAGIYVIWRIAMLGMPVGGYGGTTPEALPALARLGLTRAGEILLGQGGLGLAAALSLLASVIWILAQAPRRAPLALAIVGVALFPVVFVAQGLDARHLLGVWWALCVALALGLAAAARQRRGGGWLALLLIALPLAAIIPTGYKAAQTTVALARTYAAYGQLWLATNRETVILVKPPLADMGHYFSGLTDVTERLSGPRSFPIRAVDEIDLVDVDLGRQAVWTLNPECICMHDISAQIPDLLAAWETRLAEQPLRVEVGYHEGLARWRFGPYQAGTYYLIDARDIGRIQLPVSGELRTAPRRLSFYIRYDAPEGWITYSPRLFISMSSEEDVTWSRE